MIVAGDNLGDLSAFGAAFDLKARGGDVLRVAVDSAEAPAALSTRAMSSLTGRRDCWSSFGDYSPERCTRVFNELVVEPTFSLRTALAPSVP